MKDMEKYDDFMAAVFEQLMENHQNHVDHEKCDGAYMFRVIIKQIGHLARALITLDTKLIRRECLHVVAVVFELYIRTPEEVDGTTN